MPLTLKSGSGGSVVIDATDTTSNFTLNLPNSGGVFITSVFGNTGAIILPSGTTSQRPSSPANGHIRYNSELGYAEFYSNGSWFSV